ncbi:MAG: amidohydrolase family protein [Crocinitomicaceae bacterium]|nr:amidohydrolase family protein [Crocinitomicaceae bacterium]
MRYLLTYLLIFASILSFGQGFSPILKQYDSYVLVKGFCHTGTGEVIPSSVIGVREGKIALIKNALTYEVVEAEWDTIIDISGKHIYPGFIAPNLTVGLTEIDAVRATNDFREVGLFNPNVRALIAFNVESKIIGTLRTNGVLVTQATPRGGFISGTSSIMALEGWNWEDAVYKQDDGIHLNWPRKYNSSGWWAEPGPSTKSKTYDDHKTQIYNFFKRAEAYAKEKNPDKSDLKMEAMRGVFSDDKRVYFHADFAPELNDIIDFAREFKIKYPVIVGGYDAAMLADRIKENGFSVMIGRPHSLPKFEDDITFAPYELAYKLQDKGILFCIESSGEMEAMNTRNLPFLAGTCWGYGLSEEAAVAAITLSPARIMGIDDRLGSIEIGKDATLFVSEGNALDMRTNRAYLATVKGNFIALTSTQIELYKRYAAKFGLNAKP